MLPASQTPPRATASHSPPHQPPDAFTHHPLLLPSHQTHIGKLRSLKMEYYIMHYGRAGNKAGEKVEDNRLDTQSTGAMHGQRGKGHVNSTFFPLGFGIQDSQRDRLKKSTIRRICSLPLSSHSSPQIHIDKLESLTTRLAKRWWKMLEFGRHAQLGKTPLFRDG